MQETKNLLKMTKKIIEDLLNKWSLPKSNVSNCSMIEEHKTYLQKERIIYSTLNLFKTDSNIYQCKCWCPKEKEELVISQIHFVSRNNPDIAGGQFQEIYLKANQKPPTSFP